jgi:hypothetical protein
VTGVAKQLVRQASRGTVAEWRRYALGAALYFIFAPAAIFALRVGSQDFWLAVRDSVVTSTAALAIFVACVFVDELWKAPQALRNERSRPPAMGMRLTVQTDTLQRWALAIPKEITKYRAFRSIRGHGPQNDLQADRALAELNREIDSFGYFAEQSTCLDGSRRRRRFAGRLYRGIRTVSHETDLDRLESAVQSFLTSW